MIIGLILISGCVDNSRDREGGEVSTLTTITAISTVITVMGEEAATTTTTSTPTTTSSIQENCKDLCKSLGYEHTLGVMNAMDCSKEVPPDTRAMWKFNCCCYIYEKIEKK